MSGPQGLVASYAYESPGVLAQVTYPDGSGYAFSYTGNYLTSVTDLGGTLIERHTYDAQGRCASARELGDGQERLLFAYDRSNRRTTVTDALGKVTTYSWEWVAGLKLVTQIEARARAAAGRGARSGSGTTTPRGTWWLSGTAWATRRVTATTPTGNLRVRRTRSGRPRPTATTIRAACCCAAARTARRPSGPTRRRGRPRSGSWSRPESAAPHRSPTTSCRARRRSRIPEAKRRAWSTTAWGIFARWWTRWAGGPPLPTTRRDGGPRPRTRSGARRRRSTTLGDGSERWSPRQGARTEFTFDQGGRRTAVKDPLGRQTRYVYDAYGRLKVVVDPLDGATRYDYDVMSRLASLTDAKGQTTQFGYDAAGRVTTVTYPGGGQKSFTYDPAGQAADEDRSQGRRHHVHLRRWRSPERQELLGRHPARHLHLRHRRAGSRARPNGTDTLTLDLRPRRAAPLRAERAGTPRRSPTPTTPGAIALSVGLDGQVFLTYGYDDASRLTTHHPRRERLRLRIRLRQPQDLDDLPQRRHHLLRLRRRQPPHEPGAPY